MIMFGCVQITDACISRYFAADSIFYNSLAKCGEPWMWQQEKVDHRRFVDYMILKPAGAAVGTLLDRGLIVKVGVPAITAFTSVFSFLITRLDIQSENIIGILQLDRNFTANA